MIRDLVGLGTIEDHFDVVVIGGGTVGLPASVLLARDKGLRVACLESGGLRQIEDTHPLNTVVHLSTVNDSARRRFRCLGGTSTRWGGVLLPFQEADLLQGEWPVTLAELERYVPRVETLFGLEKGPYTDRAFPFDLGESHVNRLAKRPAFMKRNVVELFGRAARELANLFVWVNATVTEIRAGIEGTGVSVVARSPLGDLVRLTADRLVVAAGAIETTRLALLIDRQNGGIVSATSPNLGHYFSDHVSIPAAEIVPTRTSILNETLGFRFASAGGLRPIRFELAPDAQARRMLPPSYAFVDFEAVRPSSFDALREIFRSAQKRRLPPVRAFLNVLRDVPWLLRAEWWRIVKKRLLYPRNARLVVILSIEQVANADNVIRLADDVLDPLGMPLVEIDWRISETDVDNFMASLDAYRNTWNGSGLASCGVWMDLPREEVRRQVAASAGVLHPVGSTRMGKEAGSAVVDPDLRLFALPQIQLLSTSVLPTGGGANPTMMLMLLMYRCVEGFERESAEPRAASAA